jgi:hypothetical protein
MFCNLHNQILLWWIGEVFVKYRSYFASFITSISQFILHFDIQDVCKTWEWYWVLFKWESKGLLWRTCGEHSLSFHWFQNCFPILLNISFHFVPRRYYHSILLTRILTLHTKNLSDLRDLTLGPFNIVRSNSQWNSAPTGCFQKQTPNMKSSLWRVYFIQ